MISAEVSFEVDVVLLNLGWEGFIIAHSSLFVSVTTFATVVLEVFNSLVELLLEHVESVDGSFKCEVGKVLALSAEFVKVDTQSVIRLCDHALNTLLDITRGHVLINFRPD